MGCVEEVATSVKRILQQTCPISAVPCSSSCGTLLALHDPIITVVRGGCSIGWFVDDYRCVCGLLLVRGQTTIRPAYERLYTCMRDEYLYEGNRLFLLCSLLHRSSKAEEQAPRGGRYSPLSPVRSQYVRWKNAIVEPRAFAMCSARRSMGVPEGMKASTVKVSSPSPSI